MARFLAPLSAAAGAAASGHVSVAEGGWLEQPRELRSQGGALDVTLVLDQHLFKGPGFDVWTRAYNNSVPGPTLRIRAGDTLRIKLLNRLGPNDPAYPYAPDSFGRMNTTNLHFHGYHGSPMCGGDVLPDPYPPGVCSDNVLVDVEPGEEQQYQYALLPNLAAGLFWYHPHVEGSTAVQVGAGAAGAIVIEDGEADAVPRWLSQMEEVVMVVQEVFMRDCNIPGIRFKGCPGTPGLEAQGHGGLSKVQVTGDDPVLWYFMINGQYLPKVNMTAGVWQRWRMVMAGANTNLRLELPGCELQLLAKDGIFVSPMPRNLHTGNSTLRFPPPGGNTGPATIFLSPANRAEVAVRCPAGAFALRSVVAAGLPGQPIFPGPDGANATLATVIAAQPASPVTPVELTPVTPHRPDYLRDLTQLPDSAIDGRLTLQLLFNGPQDLTLNGRKFSGHVDVTNASTYLNEYKVGTVQEWTYAPSGTHPFHMHVNPMQILTYPAASDYGNWMQVGDFHDVMRLPFGGGQSKFRFLADRFTGNIVMHCHILRHEDLGLMAVSLINS